MNDDRVPLPGSELKLRVGERLAGDPPSSQTVDVTVLLRKRRDAPSEEELLSGRYHSGARPQAEQALAASPNDIAAVRAFANQYGLKIIEESAQTRRIHLEGTVQQIAAAFGVHLAYAQDSEGHQYLTYNGSISVPKSLAGIVVAVLGLDQRPVARHRAPAQ
ncbi:MAG: hypothetical protein JOZ62_21985 [Acidobacteriaceae bacterium]|nr:hypothetical protein [Acidobacteriaceae bacterium]